MPDYWERSYRSGEMGWDIGRSTPIFDQWIKTCKEPLLICVLGAGNGWDAIHFASRGHAVTAVDFSESAVKNMQSSVEKYRIKIDIRHMDIFNLHQMFTNHFDVVLEYTCFCAIDPLRRRDYLEMVYDILKPNGELFATLPYDLNLFNRKTIFTGHSYQEFVYKKFGHYKHHTFFSEYLLKFMLNVSSLNINSLHYLYYNR